MRTSAQGGRLMWPLAFVAAVVLAVMVVLAAQPAGGATSSSGLALAKKNLEAMYKGQYKSPPSTSPKPAKGKNIWFITISLNTPGAWAKGAREAGKAIGWNVKVWDGKFSPATQLEGVQQAIANKADGIMLDAIDCGAVKAGLEQARKAGIKVVNSQGVDCKVAGKGKQSLFDGTVVYGNGGSLQGFNYSFGRAKADWVAVKTKGKGKIINVVRLASFKRKWNQPAIKTQLAKVCPGCEIVDEIVFPDSDLYGPGLRQKIEQSLLQHPEANAMIIPFDDVLLVTGGDAAIRNSGRSAKLHVIGEGGYPSTLKEIKSDTGIDATLSFSFEWDSWAMIDGLNRLFHGQKPVLSGSAGVLIDRGHNDKSTNYVPPIDFKAAYRKAWRGR